MLHITQGELPKKPIFAITRGYTQELWDMTSSCWDADPTKRPVVDHVLEALVIAADLWKPKDNQLSTLSPQDDWGSTVSEAPEPENEPADDTPGSPHPSQPLATNTAPSALPGGGGNESRPDFTSGKFVRKTTRYFSHLIGGKAA